MSSTYHHRHLSLKPIIFSTKNSSRYRFILLLFLTAYAGLSVLRLSLSSAPPSSPTDRLPSTNEPKTSENEAVLAIEAISREIESNLKTHIHSENKHLLQSDEHQPATPISCSSLIDGRSTAAGEGRGLLCCDRNNSRTDVCYMRGDIRLDTQSSSIFVYGTAVGAGAPEKIRPYTRKFEKQLMSTISEITIHPINESRSWRRQPACEVRHDGVPGVVFSAGGYTGNLYHEFSDGLIPLYLTAGRFHGEVVLVITEKRAWWYGKYQRVLEKLSNYKVIDFAADRRIHCFSEMIVGVKFHGEMIINPALMPNGIYVGDGMVIHFTRSAGQEIGTGTFLDQFLFSSSPDSGRMCERCDGQSQHDGVIISCIDCFLSGGNLYLFHYSVTPSFFIAKTRGGTCTLAASDPSEIVIHRARYLLDSGFGVYNIFKNNCEDFAIYCKTGLLVETSFSVGRSGQLSSLTAAFTAVMSSPLRFLTTGPAGLTLVAGSMYSIGRYVSDIGVRRDVCKIPVENLVAQSGGLNEPPELSCAAETN